MTEPDNDHNLHESVRQGLAAHQPPFDPANWQRMRRKLRRERWRAWAWSLTGVLMLSSIGWYAIDWSPTLPNLVQPVANRPPDPRTTPPTEPVRRPKSRNELPNVAEKQLQQTSGGPKIAATDRLPISSKSLTHSLPLEPHSVQPLPVGRFADLPPVVIHSPDEPDIIQRVMTNTIGADSTTYRAFFRNITRWPNAVVVCDFTSSMYRYNTQLMAWFQKNQANKQVRGLVFFTDCDSLGHETEPGLSGQLFYTRSQAVGDVLPLMLASARNTMGNVTDAENNIDPLVYAQRQFPEAEHLILIADNSSAVKDMVRLPELRKPVHVILCGPTRDTSQAFQPDYYTIARQTGGSLHTLEDDLTNLAQRRPTTWIRVGGHYYRTNRRGRFVVTRFRHRPRRVLRLFWR